MSRILCPECGTKISDKATKCPHCGFQSADPKRPISEQDKYEMVPIFEYDIEEWQPNRGELSIISYGQYILGKPANGLGNRAIYQPAAS